MAQRKYYKIPKKFIEELGLANQLIPFPDQKTYLCTSVVMARIHPDINEALRITGGISLTPDQARDEQMGNVIHPLPGDIKEESKPLYGGEPEQTEQSESSESAENPEQSENSTDDTSHTESALSPSDNTDDQTAEGGEA